VAFLFKNRENIKPQNMTTMKNVKFIYTCGIDNLYSPYNGRKKTE